MPDPDVKSPKGAAVAEPEDEEQVQDEVVTEEEETTEETTEASSTEETESEGEAETEEEAGDDEPSADQLRIQKLEEELAAIKAGKGDEKPTEEKKVVAGERRMQHIEAFVTKAVPQLKAEFTKEGATPQDQWDTIFELTNQMVGAVLADRIQPNVELLAAGTITLQNEVTIRDLRAEYPRFKAVEKEVRARLEKLPWAKRGEDTAVQDLFHAIVGKSTAETKPMPTTKTPVAQKVAAKIMKDVAAGTGGGGAKTPGNASRLTADQEAERKEMSDEQGYDYPAAKYLAKLKARQDRAKAAGQPIPQVLRQL